MFGECWLIFPTVFDTRLTFIRHWVEVMSLLGILSFVAPEQSPMPASTIRETNDVLMLDHHLQRMPNINPALAQCFLNFHKCCHLWTTAKFCSQ